MNDSKFCEPCDPMPANRAKHLFSAIRSVNSIIEHIESIKDQLGINCNPMSTNDQKEPNPTVVLLMNEGANALNQMIQQAHQSLEDIERELL